MGNRPKKIGKLAELIFLVLYGTLMFVLKWVMMYFPNIEPVSVMIIALAASFGAWSLLSVYVYVLLEFLILGIGIWNVMYLYVWALLAMLIILLQRPLSSFERLIKHSKGFVISGCYTFISGLFGLGFGTLCCIPYIFAFGIEYAIAWVVSGFGFDVTHCVGNVVMTAVLFFPLQKVLLFAKRKFRG